MDCCVVRNAAIPPCYQTSDMGTMALTIKKPALVIVKHTDHVVVPIQGAWFIHYGVYLYGVCVFYLPRAFILTSASSHISL